KPVALARHGRQCCLLRRSFHSAVQVYDDRNLAMRERDIDLASDPFGSECARAANHHDLEALNDLAASLPPEVVASHIFSLVNKDAKSCLLEPLLETARQSHSVAMAVGNEEVVAEDP